MSTVTLPRKVMPLTDKDGSISSEWYRWAYDITNRAGGVTGSSTNDLTLSQFEDAGIEETKALLNTLADTVGINAPQAAPAPIDVLDTSPEVASLRAQVEELRQAVEALRQGLTA